MGTTTKKITRKRVTPEAFGHVKTLAGAQLTTAQIANVTDLSEITVMRIKRADSFETYIADRRASMLAWRAKNDAKLAEQAQWREAKLVGVSAQDVHNVPQATIAADLTDEQVDDAMGVHTMEEVQEFDHVENSRRVAERSLELNEQMVGLYRRGIQLTERQVIATERLADAWEAAPAKKGLFK